MRHLIALLFFLPAICWAEPIRIGVSTPLTGDLAEYGAAVRNGVTLAREQQAEKFSNLEFTFEDNAFDANRALSAMRKLNDIDKVRVTYLWGEVPLHAVASVAEAKHIPIISMSVDPVPAIGKHYILRSINHSAQFAQTTLNNLTSRGFKKIGVIVTEDPFLMSLLEGLKAQAKTGMTVTTVTTILPTENDFRTIVTRLLHENYDAIGIYLFPGQVSSFYRQAQGLGFKLPTFGTDIFESRSEIAKAQGGMEGAVYPNVKIPAEFDAAYRKRFTDDAQIAYAYNAYEFAKLSSEVFAGTPSATPEEVIAAYAKAAAASKTFTLRDTPDGGRFFEFPLQVKIIRGEGFAPLEK